MPRERDVDRKARERKTTKAKTYRCLDFLNLTTFACGGGKAREGEERQGKEWQRKKEVRIREREREQEIFSSGFHLFTQRMPVREKLTCVLGHRFMSQPHTT